MPAATQLIHMEHCWVAMSMQARQPQSSLIMEKAVRTDGQRLAIPAQALTIRMDTISGILLRVPMLSQFPVQLIHRSFPMLTQQEYYPRRIAELTPGGMATTRRRMQTVLVPQ